MNQQLIFQFDDVLFTVAYLNLDSKNILFKSTIRIDTLPLNEKKTTVLNWLNSLEIKVDEFVEFSLSYSGFKQIYTSYELFEITSIKKIFEFNFGKTEVDIDFKRIPELNMISIFEFPFWIKSLFVIKFPHINLFHKSVSDLKGIFNYPTFREKTYLIRENNAVSIYRISSGKVMFFNRFKVLNWEDLIYFTLLVLNNENASAKNEIFICDFNSENEINKLKSFIDESKGKINEHLNLDFSLKNQRLCV